ncbi:MAG: hypothetical protein JNJ78_07035 [Anaerolineae bacterium]|nr:hypothetical protein [Anaerolineae bacterium]
MAAENTWICRYCGIENHNAESCSHCGAERGKRKPYLFDANDGHSLQDVFFLNPANLSFVLGQTKRLFSGYPGAGCLIVFMSFFVLVGGFALSWSIKETLKWNGIQYYGVDTTAEYVSRRVSTGDSDDNYYVKFAFVHQDHLYQVEQLVSYEIYLNADEGRDVNVTYVPDNPTDAKIAGTNSPPTAIFLFSLVWNGIVWVIMGSALIHHRRVRQLQLHGQLIAGEIIKSASRRDSDNDFVVTIQYSFQVPGTYDLASGEAVFIRNDLAGEMLPAPGTSILVVYRTPSHHMML